MRALECASGSFSSRAAFQRTKLVINPHQFPPVVMMNVDMLTTPVNDFMLLDEESTGDRTAILGLGVHYYLDSSVRRFCKLID
jgi:hypothetical protein